LAQLKQQQQQWANEREQQAQASETAKLNALHAEIDTFSKDKAGKISLTCAKDRNGAYAKNQVVAEISIDPANIGLLTIAPPAGRDETGKLTRPTALMERISAFLDEQDDDVSGRAVMQMVSGNDKAKIEEKAAVETGSLSAVIGDASFLAQSVTLAFDEAEATAAPGGPGGISTILALPLCRRAISCKGLRMSAAMA
jgi:hypothetical protein